MGFRGAEITHPGAAWGARTGASSRIHHSRVGRNGSSPGYDTEAEKQRK